MIRQLPLTVWTDGTSYIVVGPAPAEPARALSAEDALHSNAPRHDCRAMGYPPAASADPALVAHVLARVPGAFYRRELGHLLEGGPSS